MKLWFILSFVALTLIGSSIASDLIVGTSYNARLKWQNKAEYVAIPLKKRVKELFYADPDQQLIKVSTITIPKDTYTMYSYKTTYKVNSSIEGT